MGRVVRLGYGWGIWNRAQKACWTKNLVGKRRDEQRSHGTQNVQQIYLRGRRYFSTKKPRHTKHTSASPSYPVRSHVMGTGYVHFSLWKLFWHVDKPAWWRGLGWNTFPVPYVCGEIFNYSFKARLEHHIPIHEGSVGVLLLFLFLFVSGGETKWNKSDVLVEMQAERKSFVAIPPNSIFLFAVLFVLPYFFLLGKRAKSSLWMD